MTSPTLDLHNLNGHGQPVSKEDVFLALDRFIMQTKLNFGRQIKSGLHVKIQIIVGKGLQSKNLVDGKNPLRRYVEEYLNLCGYTWSNAEYYHGGSGTIKAEII